MLKGFIRKHPKLVIMLAVVLGWLGFVAGVEIADLPLVCGSCHSMRPHVETWEANIHRQHGVDCMDCHSKPGLINHALAHVLAIMPRKEKKSYLKDEYGFHKDVAGFDVEQMSFEGRSKAEEQELFKKCSACHPNRLAKSYFLHVFPQNQPLLNANCRRCHTEIVELADDGQHPEISPDVHPPHLQQDIRCTSCHARIVHSTQPGDTTPGEHVCQKCHQEGIPPIL